MGVKPEGLTFKIRCLGEALLSPENLLNMVGDRPLAYGFLTVTVFSIVECITFTIPFIMSPITLSLPPLTLFTSITLTLIIIGYIVLSVSVYIIYSTLTHIISKILGGKGSFEKTMFSISIAWIPHFTLGFISPLLIYLDYLSALTLYILTFIVSSIWGLILAIKVLSRVHSYGLFKALTSTLLPLLMIIAIGLTLIGGVW